MNQSNTMPTIKNSVGTDDLVTITICSVFIFTLWRLRENNMQHSTETVKKPERVVIPQQQFFSITDCFGDVIHTNPMFAEPLQRSGTPFSDTTESTLITVDTTDTREKWEFVDTDDEFLFGEEELA